MSDKEMALKIAESLFLYQDREEGYKVYLSRLRDAQGYSLPWQATLAAEEMIQRQSHLDSVPHKTEALRRLLESVPPAEVLAVLYRELIGPRE